MGQLKQFVDEARSKGLDDDKIRQLLTENGWTQPQIDTTLMGLEVPKPPVADPQEPIRAGGVVSNSIYPVVTAGSAQVVGAFGALHEHESATTGQPTHQASRPSLHALEAALQHVLLWVFTGTSSVMIAIVSTVLFSNSASGGSSQSLLTYLVLELVTFTPFAVLFMLYLRKLRSNPELTTNKIWSIITIVFHSLGLISAVISLVLVLVLVRSDGFAAGVIGSSAIAVMDGLVLFAYVAANFMKPVLGMRFKFLMAFPALLFVLLSVFGILALMRVGPLKADDTSRQNLVDTVKAVRAYATTNKQLPLSLSNVENAKKGITYSKKTYNTYKLCATFRVDTTRGADDYTAKYVGTISSDSYVSTYDFSRVTIGENCYTITSSAVPIQSTTNNYKYNSILQGTQTD